MKVHILRWFICFLVISGNFSVASEVQNDAESHVQPMTIMASTDGMFAKGHSWRLNVNDSGEAFLVVSAFPNPISKKFIVTRDQLKELSDFLDEERFFQLKGDEFGELVLDGSVQTLTITRGSQQKSVKIHFLMNWVHNDPQKLLEPARAVRIFNIVRNWINEPEAVDLRRYNQMVLDAADKIEIPEE